MLTRKKRSSPHLSSIQPTLRNSCSNYQGAPIRIFYDHGFNENNKVALGIFTNEDSAEIDQCFERADKDKKRGRIESIFHKFVAITPENTFRINDDFDLARFIQQHLFKDLKIEDKKVLLKDDGFVKQYYEGG